MPQQVLNSVENNFTKGLLTEYTGLNFPENAATQTSNCIYTLVGDVVRREGFDYELNATTQAITRANQAMSTYKWNNAGGDGLSQLIVEQVGQILYFYRSSATTVANPLSNQYLGSVTLLLGSGASFDPTVECTYADGNGYLFVYHPSIDTNYITFNPNTLALSVSVINLQFRDFIGINDNLPVNNRPLTLSSQHQYNLQNQGWTSAPPWSAQSSNVYLPPLSGSTNFTVASGITGVSNGQIVSFYGYYTLPGQFNALVAVGYGTVTGYAGTTLTLNITSCSNPYGGAYSGNNWNFTVVSTGNLTLWHTDEGNYPSNADVWWYFKDSTGAFNPTTVQPNITLGTGQAPQGFYTLSVFNQNRSIASGISGITTVTTNKRPTNGCWFQGRIWYTGINDSFAQSSDVNYFTWAENIYFSQIVQTPTDFGNCFQTNDPTSQQAFDLLPSDGGVITIQGSGPIYKLFPLMNAMLVFAANGVWYISGNQGIGFTANDYSIVKLSAVRSISSYSYVDINGLPMFWNEEGIYKVEPAKQGQGLLNSPLHVNPLEVNPLSVGTIQTAFDAIPLQSKKFARGVYDPINYIVQWIYKNNNETSIFDRYSYNNILAYNTHNQAFYTYNFDISTNNPPIINSIVYVQSPGGLSTPLSIIKYVVTKGSALTFAEENNSTFVDWQTAGVSNNFTSSFTTGYKLHGKGLMKSQIPYVYVYSRTNGTPSSYYVQTQWDYPLNTNSGKVSNNQFTTINSPNFGMVYKRHRLRGRGIALQLIFTSVPGQPFDLMGWALYETVNQGP